MGLARRADSDDCGPGAGGARRGPAMADRPADLGLPPFGAKALAPQPLTTPAFSTPFRVLREVAPNPTFWVLAGTFFICGLSTQRADSDPFHRLLRRFRRRLGDGGVDAGADGRVRLRRHHRVRLAFGPLDNRALLFVYYGLRGLSLLYLPASSFSLPSLSLFAVFYGLDWIATVPPTVRLTAQAFGAAARRRRVRLDLRRAYARRLGGGARRRLGAQPARRLFAGVLYRGRGLSGRGAGGRADRRPAPPRLGAGRRLSFA